jgi:threonine/homoserine/homoserine lactone efflux protein
MSIVLPLISGFFAAFIGVFPPGLINMTASKISIKDGRKPALSFAAGALVVILFQTYISVIFAEYLDSHNEAIVLLREIALVVFSVLTIYFFFFAKKGSVKNPKEIKVKSKKSRFVMGILISAINLFPIPYYVLISVTLASYKLFRFQEIPIYSFVFGVVLGSFAVFYLYVVFFEKMKTKTDYLIKNMNYFIGAITGFIAIISLINVLLYYLR